MATIFVYLESAVDTPLTGASPTLDYWDKSSPSTPVATDVAMTELVGGIGGGYFVDVATTDGKEYLGLIDGTSSAKAGSRYQIVTFSGETDARIEADIPAILIDTSSIDGRLPADPADESNQLAQHNQTQADIAALNDLSSVEAEAACEQALTDQGYTTVRATYLDELEATNIPADLDAVLADTDDIQTRLPASLVGGRMRSHVEDLDAGVIDATAIATDAVDADALAADAIAEIEAKLATDHGSGLWDATAVVPQQDIRDAMKLAPSGGAPADGSIDQHLDDLLTDVAALPDGVWATVLTGYEDEDQAGGMLNWAYRALFHRQEIDFAAQRLIVYNKAGTAILGYWPLTDGDGNAVLKAVGAPARRGIFV